MTVCLQTLTITTPCARAPRRYAEPKNFQIGIAHPWSWAIGSSTSAAQRPFDMVVCRRKASSFVLITGSGLRENGRPSLTGTVRLRRMDRVWFDGLRNDGPRVFVKERAMCGDWSISDSPSA